MRELVDTMIKDGLWDAFNGYHMGNTAENVAQRWQITREQQDEFAAALAAQGRGGAEGRPLQGRDRPGQDHDAARARPSSTPTNIPKHGTTVEVLAKLRPAFDKNGTVTAGNASGINDGAAAVVLMTRRGGRASAASSRWRASSPGRPPGVDPAIMGTGPDPGEPHGAEEGRLEGRAIST